MASIKAWLCTSLEFGSSFLSIVGIRLWLNYVAADPTLVYQNTTYCSSRAMVSLPVPGYPFM